MATRRTLNSLFRLQLRVSSTQAFQMHRSLVGSTFSQINCPSLFQANQGFHTSSARQSEHIISIQDEEDFNKRVLKNTTPVIVDFFATWCGPCKLLAPRLESLIAGKNGKVILAKIDIDENTDLAVNHGVEAVPTIIGMKNGKVVEKFVGLKDDADLQSFVDKLIG